MDVRIGVIHTAKEIELDLGDKSDQAAIEKEITKVLSARSESPAILWLTDRHGRKVGVPTEKIAYVELGGSANERRVGFVG